MARRRHAADKIDASHRVIAIDFAAAAAVVVLKIVVVCQAAPRWCASGAFDLSTAASAPRRRD
jgi:hypothetical protein